MAPIEVLRQQKMNENKEELERLFPEKVGVRLKLKRKQKVSTNIISRKSKRCVKKPKPSYLDITSDDDIVDNSSPSVLSPLPPHLECTIQQCTVQAEKEDAYIEERTSESSGDKHLKTWR